jgi:hypothetical protein
MPQSVPWSGPMAGGFGCRAPRTALALHCRRLLPWSVAGISARTIRTQRRRYQSLPTIRRDKITYATTSCMTSSGHSLMVTRIGTSAHVASLSRIILTVKGEVQRRILQEGRLALLNLSSFCSICDVSWTAAFDKRCNVVTRDVSKGEFCNESNSSLTLQR